MLTSADLPGGGHGRNQHTTATYTQGLMPTNSRNMYKQQAISSGNMRPQALNEGGFAPMQSQTPVGHGSNTLGDPNAFNQQLMAGRKAKFMQPAASKASNPAGGQQPGTKHKVNLSTDLVGNSAFGVTGQKQSHIAGKNGKPISMSSMAYDRLKGLTPVGNKSNNGQAVKNSFHLHNQMHVDATHGNNERDNSVGLPYRQGGMRPGHGNQTRMPALPSNIKGSIGVHAGVSGAANGNQARGHSNDGHALNIMAANDIAFAGEYKAKFRNFAGQNT